jgi:hypothetical protein
LKLTGEPIHAESGFPVKFAVGGVCEKAKKGNITSSSVKIFIKKSIVCYKNNKIDNTKTYKITKCWQTTSAPYHFFHYFFDERYLPLAQR